MSAVVDVHCHVFNADDLPVKGFVYRLHLRNSALGAALAELADRLVQGAAPGFEADLGRLNTLLASADGFESAAVPEPTPAEQFEREVDVAVAELQGTQPELLSRVGRAVAEEEAPASGNESIGEVFSTARRAVRWVKLFGRSRLDLLADLVRDSGDQLDLCVPLMVDLDSGLGDRSRTSQRQQMVLMEKLSRATMLGLLPGAGKARMHPFIGFDPLRELHARRYQDVEKPLDLVKTAVEQYGFVGVKVYPPMGWRPCGNTDRVPPFRPGDAALLDAIVDEFAGWCAEENVPVTAHANDSNHADDAFKGFGGPDDWLRVLQNHPALRLNLGHFGGAQSAQEPSDGWPWKFADLAAKYPGVYADVGNHRIHDSAVATAYTALLTKMFADEPTAVMRYRLMYGSDWYMLALMPQHEQFLDTYQTLFNQNFGEAVTGGFMGQNALRFLGFEDPGNRNNQRLSARYKKYAAASHPFWLAR